MKELSWEYPFLRAGEGGITFSGGEPLLQAKELYSLATLLKRDGINLAIESSFYFFNDFEYIKNTLSQIDHIFIDIKILEERMAQEILGETSKFFKMNISLFYPIMTKKLVYRFILVPGFTDGMVNLETVCAFIQQFPPIELQVMPVHNLGAYKYRRLGRDYASFDSPEANDLRKTAAFFRPHINGHVSILEF